MADSASAARRGEAAPVWVPPSSHRWCGRSGSPSRAASWVWRCAWGCSSRRLPWASCRASTCPSRWPRCSPAAARWHPVRGAWSAPTPGCRPLRSPSPGSSRCAPMGRSWRSTSSRPSRSRAPRSPRMAGAPVTRRSMGGLAVLVGQGLALGGAVAHRLGQRPARPAGRRPIRGRHDRAGGARGHRPGAAAAARVRVPVRAPPMRCSGAPLRRAARPADAGGHAGAPLFVAAAPRRGPGRPAGDGRGGHAARPAHAAARWGPRWGAVEATVALVAIDVLFEALRAVRRATCSGLRHGRGDRPGLRPVRAGGVASSSWSAVAALAGIVVLGLRSRW